MIFSVERFSDFGHYLYWLFSKIPDFYVIIFVLLCLFAVFHEILKWGRRF